MFAAARIAARQQPRILGRRFASQGATRDGNTFIREREAVKKHAAESSGTNPLPLPSTADTFETGQMGRYTMIRIGG